MAAFIILIIAVSVMFLVVTYNSLVSLNNAVKDGWSRILIELKYRYDVIDNLVATVKSYAKYEKDTLEHIIKLKTQAASAPETPQGKERLEAQINRAVKSIIAVNEDYPELKSSQQFLELQNKLIKLEDTIQMARRYYNGCVRDYNNKVESFPFNILSSSFGFQKADYFELTNRREAKAPAAKFHQ